MISLLLAICFLLPNTQSHLRLESRFSVSLTNEQPLKMLSDDFVYHTDKFQNCIHFKSNLFVPKVFQSIFTHRKIQLESHRVLCRECSPIDNREMLVDKSRGEADFYTSEHDEVITGIEQCKAHFQIRLFSFPNVITLPISQQQPLLVCRLLDENAITRSSGSFASLPSLPDDCSEGEHDSPCGNPFRPSYEFVPPLRLVGCALLVIASGLIVGYGRGWRIRLVCVTLALVCSLLATWLVLCGHRWYCEGQEHGGYRESVHRSIETVAQVNSLELEELG
jgi:hypothetical protein